VISDYHLIVKYFYLHKTSSQEFQKLSFVVSNNVFFYFFNEFFALWQQKKTNAKCTKKAFVGREMQKVEIFLGKKSHFGIFRQ